jgi:hypothetical protein
MGDLRGAIENVRFTYRPIVEESEYPGKITMMLVNSYVEPKDRKMVREYFSREHKIENVLFCDDQPKK